MRKAPSRRAVLEALTLGVPLQALLPLAGFSGLSACKDRRDAHVEPVGPGQPLPFITPKSKFFQFTRGSLPAAIDSSTHFLTVGHGKEELQIPWKQVTEWATNEFERTLICDGHGFAMRSLPPLSQGHVAVGWDWRFAPIGTARWRAIPVTELFERVGLTLSGPFLLATARDDEAWFHPIDRVRDELLLAVGMNGEPLPHQHGAPGRLIASGDYGLTSLKWVHNLTAGVEARVSRDYSFPMFHTAPVKPIAFATMPKTGSTVREDFVELSGVAYAGRELLHEVSLWSGDQPDAEHSRALAADLLDPPQRFVWSRWRARLELKPGRNVINVACVDRSGRFSTVLSNNAPPEPDGWGGVHRAICGRGLGGRQQRVLRSMGANG